MVEGVVDQRQDGSGSCLESTDPPRTAVWADDTDPARRYIGRQVAHSPVKQPRKTSSGVPITNVMMEPRTSTSGVVITVALVRLTSLVTTCRRDPSSAAIA